MSQRPSASRPTSRSPPDQQRIILPPVQLRDENQLRGPAPGVGYERQAEPRFPISTLTQHVQSSAASIAGSQTSSPSSFNEERYLPTSRALGVHTMLNPATSDGGVTSSPRPGDTQSPSTSVAPTPYMIPPISGLPQSYNSQMSVGPSPSTESYNSAFPRARRILTPRSPSRITSAGRGVAEQKAPSITSERSRILRAEAGGDGSRNGPESHSHPKPSHFHPLAQGQQGNPQSIPGGMHAPSQTPHSQSTSPSTTYSSYSQPSQTSPTALYQNNPPPTSTSYFSPPGFVGSGHVGSGISQMGTEGPYRPSNMSSSSITSGPSQSSSNYQLMTFSSSLGTYQVPVDATSASRLADEKRQRNAGASARFRARRKEKEREASTQISRLESQTRKLEERSAALEEEKRQLERHLGIVEEQRDHYKSERDRFRGMLVGRTGDRELGSGPPSPPSTRTPIRSSSNYSTPNTLYRPSTATSESPVTERAPRRRRTEAHGEFTPLPPSQGPVHASSYRTNPDHGQSVSSTLPPLRIENVSAAGNMNTQAAPSSAATTPGQFNSYSPAQRKWTGGLPPPPSGPQDRR